MLGIVMKVGWLLVLAVEAYMPRGFISDNEIALKQALAGQHRRDARPVIHASTIVNTEFDIALRAIVGLDLKNQVLKTSIWVRIYWTDEFLTWDPKDFGNLTSVNFLKKDIWVPDIVLYNSASEDGSGILANVMNTDVTVNHKGEASWFCPVFLSSDCSVDIAMFPFDRQSCELKFGLWSNDGLKVNITPRGAAADTNNTATSGEWLLEGMPSEREEVKYNCCPDVPYPIIRYHVKMQRRTKFYLFNLIIPGTLIGLVAILTFILPPACGERVGIGITNLLAMMVFLLLVYDSIPATSDAVPIVGKVFMFILVLCGLALFCTCIVLNISSLGGGNVEDVPYFVRVHINQYLAACLFVAGEQRRWKHLWKCLLEYKPKQRPSNIQSSVNEVLMNECGGMNNGDGGIREYRQSFSAPPGYPPQIPPPDLPANCLDVIAQKYKREEDERACAEEWSKCASVMDRAFLVMLLAVLFLTMHHFLALPDQLVVA